MHEGYTSKIISTIVDDDNAPEQEEGYTSKIISTIVDCYLWDACVAVGYTSKIISTIVDVEIVEHLCRKVILLKYFLLL